MSKKVILLLLVFIFSFNKSYAGWEKIFLGNDRMRVIHFFNYNTGYVVSYSGIVFKTTNAGINWSSNALGKNVYAGEFFNDSNYILTGNNEYNFGWIGVFKNNIRADYFIYPDLLLFLHLFSTS